MNSILIIGALVNFASINTTGRGLDHQWWHHQFGAIEFSGRSNFPPMSLSFALIIAGSSILLANHRGSHRHLHWFDYISSKFRLATATLLPVRIICKWFWK